MKLNFPNKIPVFPLSGVIYFPKTNLPLNIFEKKYLDLVNDCMKNNKLMGMVQSKKIVGQIYKIGCLGRIEDFRKSDDGRILINLSGLIRFEIKNEIINKKSYREFEVKYEKFMLDTNDTIHALPDKKELDLFYIKIKNFFKKNGLLLNWKEFENLEQEQQINTLAMIAPITNEEKQKLLETITIGEKIKMLSDILEFYHYETNLNNITVQ
jgi:Lon protease-like protein|tara:strand:- start:4102 stop:4734 length:633 start_codon:yes stop_codon:yes gene_type:complete